MEGCPWWPLVPIVDTDGDGGHAGHRMAMVVTLVTYNGGR